MMNQLEKDLCFDFNVDRYHKICLFLIQKLPELSFIDKKKVI